MKTIKNQSPTLYLMAQYAIDTDEPGIILKEKTSGIESINFIPVAKIKSQELRKHIRKFSNYPNIRFLCEKRSNGQLDVITLSLKDCHEIVEGC